jgi:hypothetical protein
MKENIIKQLVQLNTKYGWILHLALKNMRLLLLLLFAVLAFYLVNRVNTLVNSDGSTVVSSDSPADSSAESMIKSGSISKTPDAEVLSTFNELSVQQVQLDSSFESSRDNPF